METWPLDEIVNHRVAGERFFYRRSTIQEISLLNCITTYQFVCMIGADVIDGAYNPGSVTRRLSLLRAAAQHGRATAVLGASYNEHPERTTCAALAGLSSSTGIYARDPISHSRLSEALRRPVGQTADIAFLLKPKPELAEARRVIAWIANQRQAGRRILALNANYLHAAKIPQFRESLSRFVECAVDADVALVMVPHDSRTDENDRQLLEHALPAGGNANIEMVRTDSPGAIKAILGQVDALFSGRLHAMILAMGCGTPALGMAYQGKFEGMLQLFGLHDDGLLYTPADLAKDPLAAFGLASTLLERSTAIRGRIEGALPNVVQMSRQNFALA